jgi:hypothetical protein
MGMIMRPSQIEDETFAVYDNDNDQETYHKSTRDKGRIWHLSPHEGGTCSVCENSTDLAVIECDEAVVVLCRKCIKRALKETEKGE